MPCCWIATRIDEARALVRFWDASAIIPLLSVPGFIVLQPGDGIKSVTRGQAIAQAEAQD